MSNTFYSRFFDADHSATHIFHTFLLKPFLYGLFVIMVVSYISILRNVDPLAFLLWGTGIWYLIANFITWQYLDKQIAFITISDEFAQIASPLAIASPKPSKLVTGFRLNLDGASVNLGETVYEFRRQDWEKPDMLFAALEKASNHGSMPIWV